MLQTLPSRRTDPSGSAPPVSGAYKVDISRGERIGRVSSEWFSRPDDERYLSLTELHAAVRGRAERATARTVETKSLRVEASRDDAQRLTLMVPGRDEPVAPTHWSYGQLCSLVGAPASYMRQLPAPLAGINLQHGLLSHRAEVVKTLEADEAYLRARAITAFSDCTALRFHPHCYYRGDEDDPADTAHDAWPALIAAVTDECGTITGVHRTWLDPSGSAKAPVSTPRRSLGLINGRGVRIGRPAEVLVIGEGLETMLSLRSILPTMPMIAVGSANHLDALLLPDGLRRLYVAEDMPSTPTWSCSMGDRPRVPS